MNFEDELSEIEKASKYIDTANAISPVIYCAIENMKNNDLMSADIELLSTKMEQIENESYGEVLGPEFCKIYRNYKNVIGVFIKIFDKKIFLHYHAAENMCGPMGTLVAKEYIYPFLKEQFTKELALHGLTIDDIMKKEIN